MSIGNMIVNVLGVNAVTSIINASVLVKDVVVESFTLSAEMTRACIRYLTGVSNTWIFLKEMHTPIPASFIEDYETNSDIVWEFNTSTKVLLSKGHNDDVVNSHMLPWLSASIYCNDHLYNFDKIGEQLVYESEENIHPTPKLLLHCWSILHKKWFNPSNHIYFEIIDHNGDVHQCPVYNRTSDDMETWRRLFESDEESDDEVESEKSDDNTDEESEEGNEEGDKEDDHELVEKSEIEEDHIDSGAEADNEDEYVESSDSNDISVIHKK